MKEQTEKRSGFNLMYLAIIAVILLIMLVLIIKQGSEDKITLGTRISLWNGQDFTGWIFFLADSAANPDTVFTVNNDFIRINGQPFGYMKTSKEYKDYNLHLEWRWPEEPGNSGVFLNITGKDTKWPMTIECQLMSGRAGDLVFLGGSDAIERVDKEKLVIPGLKESSENPPGTWNTYDIHNRNDSITVYVNGFLQNYCTMPVPNRGYIGLQSEGAAVEFRNIYLILPKEE